MTLLHLSKLPAKKNGRAKRLPPKPITDDDVGALLELSQRLRGEPIPGVRATEEEFDAWCDEDVRAEWIDGEVILLSPSNIPDADLNLWLGAIIRLVVELEDAGQVFTDQVQVRLEAVKQRRNPDVVLVTKSRQHIIQRTYIDGPPDLVMEIVSPDSEAHDWRHKFKAYEKSAVREYWIVDPGSQHVEAYTLGRDGKYSLIPEADGKIKSKVLRSLYIRPEWLWKSPLPKIAVILKELGLKS
jgi:Uma2 family endonuclease